MRKPIWLAVMSLAVILGLTLLGAARSVRAADSQGTEVYVVAGFNIPATKMGDATNIRNQTMFRAQIRAARANMSAVDISLEITRSLAGEGASREITEGELRIKGRNVADPEEFRTFLTRQGVWKVLDENGKDIFTLKSVKKVSVGTGGDQLAVLVSTKQLSGAAKGVAAGTELPVTLVLDGEKTPMTLKVASDGTTAILSMPGLTETHAWQLRSLISLAPYPCTLTVTDFRFGDDLLRQIIGW